MLRYLLLVLLTIKVMNYKEGLYSNNIVILLISYHLAKKWACLIASKKVDPPVSTHKLAFLKIKQILRPVHQNLDSVDTRFLDLNILEMRNKIGKYIFIYQGSPFFLWYLVDYKWYYISKCMSMCSSRKIMVPCVKEVVTPFYIVSYYTKWGNYFLDTQ